MCLKFGLKTDGILDLFQVPLLELPKLILGFITKQGGPFA